ncbi:Uncharacterized protein APZ42_029708 [Daphnia magna]|uniref:Uncharacterized protein n=1 Tax=Daphnia magna TaxID=35525 RepID=A0A164PDV7_9CRUS|nr:Uncharacterized protein APZ42_029708 [Daphnia magna]
MVKRKDPLQLSSTCASKIKNKSVEMSWWGTDEHHSKQNTALTVLGASSEGFTIIDLLKHSV